MKIQHDIHAHTHLSLCAKEGATIEFYARSAAEKGVKCIGIADHMWSSEIPFPDAMYHAKAAGRSGRAVYDYYRVQNVERCMTIREEIARTDTGNVRFLVGGEVEYVPGHGLAVTEREAEQLDFIVVPNSHTHMIMEPELYEPYRAHGEFMLRAAMEIVTCPMSRYVTSLAHPFVAICCPYPRDRIMDTIRDGELEEVFYAAREKGIAIEINGSAFNRQSPEEIRNMGIFHVLEVARKCGCLFTFGTDCHCSDGTYNLAGVEKAVSLLGLSEDDLHPLVRV